MTYLEEAAAELRKAIADNEERARKAEEMRGALPSQADGILREVEACRAVYAEGFTRLAAIEAGLPPCPGHVGGGDKEPAA